MDREKPEPGRPGHPSAKGSLFDRSALFDKPELLKGVRVLEVCSVVLGPAACDYLAEFGAEVIKFEGQKGDQMRFVTPYAWFWK
ncbi:MAG: putative acyl-CoA transferase/carnitine dehydratase, partial [Deltaproteobacteria bacterium]|nr:putative acyl-CoA transferase/carnitine dehydratase [Deltaproteobacteria bacterium]